MKILIQAARIIDPSSPHNNKVNDVFIENGIIVSIAKSIPVQKNMKVIGSKGMMLSPGWFDLHARFCDPGHEYKEDIESGTRAAAQGGFTGVLVMPGTTPVMHSKATVEYVLNKTKNNIVETIPAGALSRNLEGKELAEMFDMYSSGARAFTDDKHPISDSGLLMRALLYTKNFKGLIMQFPMDKGAAGKGSVHEGVSSTRSGLSGIPAMAEEIMIARDLKIAAYAEAPIHFSTISTAASVKLIREAKKKGMKVSADVSAQQLALEDTSTASFDSNFKVMPPFRGREDRMALIEGVADGTIDAVCSDHTPEDVENKKKEFDYAAFGTTALETAFSAVQTYAGDKLSTEQMVKSLAVNPRKILGLPVPVIKEGNQANITLFTTDQTWTPDEKKFHSRSANNPFLGVPLKGKVLAVINRGMLYEAN